MRPFLQLTAVLLAVLFIPLNGFSQTDIYVRGSGKLFPIAMPQLCLQGGEGDAPREIPRIMGRDLDLSGYFEVLSPESYIESPGRCGGPEGFAYSDWSVIGAEGLVRGVVSPSAGGIRVQLYLHDVQKQSIVLGKEYVGDTSQIPMMAHRFANEIMRFFTGEAGVFGTQIAFSSRVGRFKELYVMDMDGSNLRQLTDDRALAMSSSWDRSGRKLLFTSYRTRMPDLFEIDVASRSSRQLTRGGALEIGAQYTPDGSSVILSVSEGRDSDLVLLNLDGSLRKKLTSSNGAIDVSPSFSPDGSQLAFCSNRSGGPQIYVMGSDGSNPRRISFVTSNYCTSPAWSPKGDKIAFVCRADAGFQTFVSGIDGSNPMQLTSLGSNEDPSWSPDGRYIAFATTSGGKGAFSIALMRADGSGIRELTRSRGGDYEPAWGPVTW